MDITGKESMNLAALFAKHQILFVLISSFITALCLGAGMSLYLGLAYVAGTEKAQRWQRRADRFTGGNSLHVCCAAFGLILCVAFYYFVRVWLLE